MKAMVCRELGAPEVLKLEERPSTPPGPGDVRVRLRAAALNFPDLLMIGGGYQVKPDLPFVPGIEASGEIVEAGAEVSGWKVGDKAIVTSVGDPLGLYADEVTCPATALEPMPDGLSFAEAAGYIVTYSTGYHALVDRGQLKAGETLLVHGASGGVGTAAVQLGLRMGATVIGTGGDDAKLSVVKELGAHHVINVRTEDLRTRVKELTGGRGADVIYDPVGGEVFEASMRCVALEGRILIIGATSGTYAPVKTNHILIKEIGVIGVLLGNWRRRHPDLYDANMRQVGEWAAEGSIKPHIGRSFPLAEAAEALNAMARREIVGKCVLTMD